jgi:hypothetical protein
MTWLDRLVAILPHLPPSPTQLIGLAAVMLVAVALCGLGSAVAGRERLSETDGFVGWGIATAAFTLVGTVGPIPFTSIAALLLVASVVMYAVRFQRADAVFPPGIGRALLLGVPFFVLTASMTPSQWDEFTQWLHSARYLFQYDGFPGRDRPVSGALLPAYPYALPLVGYLASRIADRFVESAIASFNLLMLLAVALLFVRLMRSASIDARQRPAIGERRGEPADWGLIGLGLLSVTLLSPTFVPKLVLTAYAETGTAATVAVAGVLGWAALERAGIGDHATARRLAARMGLVLVVLVALKEATLSLFGLVLGGVALAALRRADLPARAAAPLLAVAALPGLLVYGAWRVYVARELPGQELAVMPLAQWNWAVAPAMLASMAKVALAKAGHFGLMAVIAGVALRALVRPRGRGSGGLESLAIIAASVMVGYNLFLLVTYLAVFDPREAVHAASYWRYNTHVGLIGMAVAVSGAAMLWRRLALPRLGARTVHALGAVAVVLIALGPLGLLDRFRFDVQPMKLFARQVGETLGRTLPIDSRLIVVDPSDPGFYPFLVNYALDGRAHVVGAISSLTIDPRGALRRLIVEQRPTHLLAFEADPAVAAVTETELPGNAATLLTHERDGQWRLTRSWPMPGAGSQESGVRNRDK